jgi:hypothetical protein
MHPVMTEKLAAERIRDMLAQGAGARRASAARQARQARTARQARQVGAARRGGQAPAPRPGTPPVVPHPRESQENHDRRSAPGRPGAAR